MVRVRMFLAAGLMALAGAGRARGEGLVLSEPLTGKLPFTVGPSTTVVTAVNGEGMPDYAGALNERYGRGVTPENNAAVVWLRLMGDGILPEDGRAAVLKAMGTQATPPGAVVWTGSAAWLQGRKDTALAPALFAGQLAAAGVRAWKAADYPEVAAFLKENEGLLALMTEAGQRPRWFWPTVLDHNGMLVTGARYAGVGEMTRLLAARADLRAAAGDFAGYREDVLTMLRLGQLWGGGATMIERVLGAAAQQEATETVAVAADARVFSAAQWKDLASATAAFSPVDVVEPLDVMERYRHVWGMEQMATGTLDKMIAAEDPQDAGYAEDKAIVAHRRELDWNLMLERINADIDEVVKIYRMPAGAARTAAAQAMHERLENQRQAAMAGDHVEPAAGESWQAYTLRLKAIISNVFTETILSESSLARQDEVNARWARLRAMLEKQAGAGAR